MMSRQRLLPRMFAASLVVAVAVVCGGGVVVTQTFAKADDPFEVVKTDEFEGVIVPRERAADFMKAFSGMIEKETWTPGKSEIIKLEAKIKSYLKKAAAKRSPNLWSKLATYKRQYIGIVRNGRKVIFSNFFCQSFDMDWKTTPVAVDDGGDCFFTVLHDPGSAVFSDLRINGEA
jgi:hypothetical protein